MVDHPGIRTERDAFGVYIHWPFCAQKCPYCDFNSHVRFGGWDETRFLAAYLREIDHVADRIGTRSVRSIFFGGGTPSLMKPETVAGILDHIARRWSVAADAEITLEANPGSVEAGRFAGYRTAGVNRVSMGLQSLRDSELKKLGRIHTVAEAKAALDIARRTFNRYSFDLIYARPGQTIETWRPELAEALDLAGDHLSLYQLTIEPDTPYAALHAAGKLVVPDADVAAQLYELTQDMMAAAGFETYEISNYARPGEESRHNLLYWRYGEYAGIGPGAHGRLHVGADRVATVAERVPETWCATVERDGHGFVEQTVLSGAEQADEALLMGLRLREGIDLQRLAQLGGVRPSVATLDGLSGLGLLQLATEPFADQHSPRAHMTWERDELAPILACAGPGLVPEPTAQSAGASRSAPARFIRATPKGRFVLNAIVAELAASFEAAADSAPQSLSVDTPPPAH
ncbi:MAG: radical SAM family heme chaperone HemW [Hyphomicrobium sp.]